MAKNKFKSPSELADFLKEIVIINDDLLTETAKNTVNDAVDYLYNDEADVNYEDSFEDSGC